MTRVAIFTPTMRPGIDVSHASIKRQKCDADILWIVADQLFGERVQVFKNFTEQDKNNGLYEYRHFYTPKKENNVRTLAQAYNSAIYMARQWEADLFISMQDYIYIPEDGIQKFIVMDEEIKGEGYAKSLYTGITSISNDPSSSEVHDIGGMYTIFNQPFYDRPNEIEWMDVRYRSDHLHPYNVSSAIEFETNWACFTKEAIFDENLFFDEIYDEAVAYENQDYAFRAMQQGYNLFLAFENQAISLPHKRYFSEEWNREKPLTDINRQRTEERWVA